MLAGATTVAGDDAGRTDKQIAARPAIDLLVIQPTAFCNINCRYCYLPARDNRTTLSMSTLRNLFRKVFASGWTGSELDVVWHAGEPMTLPIAFYREAFRAIDDLTPPGTIVNHAMQTNATLITDAWCDFLLAEDVAVGVSIDGPQRFHDANRQTRSGRGTFDRTIAGIRMLRRRNVPFHAITVLTEDSMRCASEMFAFMVAEGIHDVGFNVEESEGSHVSPSLAAAGIEDTYETFIREFWLLASTSPDTPIAIREINTALEMLLTPRGPEVTNPLTQPFAVISMDSAGNVSTFSPELLGLKNAVYGDFLVGNVNKDSFADMQASTTLARLHRDIAAGVQACATKCAYFAACGGGEPVNKLFETGRFDATETMHCRLTRMRIIDLVMTGIETYSSADPA